MVAPSGDTGVGCGARLGAVPGGGSCVTALVLAELMTGNWCQGGLPSYLARCLGFACSQGTLRNLLWI